MADVINILTQRRSVRAFTDAPVPRETLARICTAARSAPSGANLQPGKFHVLAGDELTGLKSRLAQAVSDGAPIESEYSYFPADMSPTLKNRQRAAGFALYDALGIGRRDVAARRANFDRNYRFFDAPVGIVVTIDRGMGKGCFMDLGLSLMSLFLAAEAEGLGSSGIGALANFGSVVHGHLGLPADEMVVCGVALGVADMAEPVNQFRTARAQLADFTSFRGFDSEQ
tara:strand:+ start:15429 stop:16112 length:684 start_codon:yes stop_codon:yes gene_type:complete